jgi:mRNA interferase RelE/StbE
MKTLFKSSFLSDVRKVKDNTIRRKLSRAITSVENATTIQDIPHIKKLKGAKKGLYYRIKVDDYRIGMSIENEIATFAVFKNRKDIYKLFP